MRFRIIKNIIKLMQLIRHIYYVKFSLLYDKASNNEIDEAIQHAVMLRGATAWILVCAIFIASIGLNINSTAVIIGAMLISPLMGPIIGVGYSAGTYDFPLMKRSLLNLAITSFIGLAISALYFWVSPISNAQSELLGRTSPTIWDVLIAFFGGIVGIIGLTRKEKTTIIPGVAIATALMPPLCTAGYELTQLNFKAFSGALYLFTINCVFIAFSTTIMVWLIRIPRHQFVSKATEKKVKLFLFLIAFITLLPSIYLATIMVEGEFFVNNTQKFITREFDFKRTYITNIKFSPNLRQVELTLVGRHINESEIHELNNKFKSAGMGNVVMILHQADETQINPAFLTNDLLQSKLYQNTIQSLDRQEKEIDDIKLQLKELSQKEQRNLDIALELEAQYPQLDHIIVSNGVSNTRDKISPEIILNANSTKNLKKSDLNRIQKWLEVRVKSENVKIYITQPKAKKRKKHHR
jgi:uncharacterized hydrophobic protein (TIGR00271 family)